jgi:hypothetical protein
MQRQTSSATTNTNITRSDGKQDVWQTLDAIPKCNDNIATSEAIADTGATSIFIMEGADVKNKRPAI